MKEEIKLSSNEKTILEVFMKETDTWGEVCLNVKNLLNNTQLEEKEIRKCCRKLTQLKLIEYMRGLMDDDGKVAGAGYCITVDGKKYMFPCQKEIDKYYEKNKEDYKQRKIKKLQEELNNLTN